MKCSQCRKDIPNGFVDCPWCGAAYAPAPPGGDAFPATGQLAASEFDAARPKNEGFRILMRFLVGGALSIGICFLCYLAALKSLGPPTRDPAYFTGGVIGRCLVCYGVPGIFVLIYYRLRRRKPHRSRQFLVTSYYGLLWAFLALNGARPHDPYNQHLDEVLSRAAAQQKSTQTHVATKWDPVMQSVYRDLQTQQQQYVDAIAKLDTTAVPLYRPESFRDPQTIRQVLAQLQNRLEVGRQFSTPQAALAKLPEYAMQIDATDGERKQFVDEFGAQTRKALDARKLVFDNEQEWVQNAGNLYRFALAHPGEYTLAGGKIVFPRKSLQDDFDRKLEIAKLSRLEFLRAHALFVATENKMFAEAGAPLAQPAPFPRAP